MKLKKVAEIVGDIINKIKGLHSIYSGASLLVSKFYIIKELKLHIERRLL